MADKILVSTEEMKATVGKYNEAQQTMTDAQQSMKKALDNLNSCWKGIAWAALMAKWTQIEANIIKSQMAVNRSVIALQNTISGYESSEEENVNTGRGLEVGEKATIYVD